MLIWIVFLPLLVCLFASCFSDILKNMGVHCLTTLAVGLSMVLSIASFFPQLAPHLGTIPLKMELFVWLPLDNYDVYWALRFDPLVKVMIFVVTTVSFLVHVYSIGYMAQDSSSSRFMIFLSLFTFFMLLLVTADNFVQLFCGWEGVGLCSYLLIGFWNHKRTANQAAMKAFIVNRVADLGLILAMALMYYHFGSLDFDTIFEKLPTFTNTEFFIHFSFLDAVTLLLFIGAMGKSAQFGLHIWLPDAMEGPTPVSALIHAATMVTAGVFLMVRCSVLLEYAPITKDIILIIGTLTSFFAASVAIVQTDIKRIIAYSTCSQLGYMFMAIGSGFYTGALFHLYTHAFFKALLFLGAGSIIHAFSDEQNIGKMGNAWKRIPLTYAVMWVGNLALVGFPFASGFYSKDAIIHNLSQSSSMTGQFAYFTGLFVSFLTAFYIFRLLFLVFHGHMKANDKVVAHIHEAPYPMRIPLLILALLALFIGALSTSTFLDPALGFWKSSNIHLPLHALHVKPDWTLVFPLLGFGLAYLIYIYNLPLNTLYKTRLRVIYQFCAQKWFIDELYGKLIIKPLFSLARYSWKVGEDRIIENAGPRFFTSLIKHLGIKIRLIQTGYMSDYILIMFASMVIFLFLSTLWIFYGGIVNVR